MNTGVKKAYAGLIGSGMLALAAVAGLAGSGSSTVLTSAPAAAASMLAPAAREVFSNPVDVSNNRLYDNTPDIGASPINGAVTIGWEQRDVSGNENDVMAASNTGLGTRFQPAISLETADYKQNGNVRVRADANGVRHVVAWEYKGSGTCDYYAQILPTGAVGQNIQVPGSCNGQKNVASAVGADGSLNVLFGKDLNNIGYYRREANGTWSVTNNYVPVIATPKNIAITISKLGVVMAAYVDRGPAHNDVYTTTRNPDGTWTAPEDITANVRTSSWNNPHTPSLDKDPHGGIRLVWSQATRNDGNATYDDVFYREWLPGTGWNNQPVVQLTDNAGNSYLPDIAVDWGGQSHIAWQDDTGRGSGNFTIQYAVGSGRTFTVYGAIFPQFGNAYTKEASLDVSPPIASHPFGNVHIAAGSVRDDPQKEDYYSWADIVFAIPPATPTPAASPTPCSPGNFSDVHPIDYYYQAVHDLSIAGIISGYSDCTFRPLNNITRGQAAKIMVLAANIMTNTTGAPHFTDVPPTNTFYNYIETAYNAGVISGYSDHTFRPGNNITRGQASKMGVNAFHLAINTRGGPHFTDVPTTNAFYRWIETAYNNGLISGYSDHTFRPSNNITRGQAAKIVWLARSHMPTHTPTPTRTPIAEATLPPSTETATVTTTPVVVTATPTDTPIVVTATETETPVVVTATPTETQVVVTATATATGTALASPKGSTR